MTVDLIRQNRRGFLASGKILVCVLLAALFFYNPFLALGKTSNHLTVCHPASYRSTVASSEVEQFAPPAQPAAAPSPSFVVAVLLIPELTANESALHYRLPLEVISSPQTGFSSSLWFRPPPAV